MPENQTPEQVVSAIQEKLAESANSGIQSTSVDGVSVTKQSAADQKIALDEAKKAAVTKFPIAFFSWK